MILRTDHFSVGEYTRGRDVPEPLHDRVNFLLAQLQKVRTDIGKPLHITSGYRSAKHEIERMKERGGGWHTKGLAVDVRVEDGVKAGEVLEAALAHGFKGIGVSRKSGRSGFLHLDLRPSKKLILWSY